MTAAVHRACQALHAALYESGTSPGAVGAPLALSLLRTVPRRDYDARVTDEHSSLRAPWHAAEPAGVRVKPEPTDDDADAKPRAVTAHRLPLPPDVKPDVKPASAGGDGAKSGVQLAHVGATSTLHATESRLGRDATATKLVDMSGGQWCTPAEIGAASASLCAFYDRIYEADSDAARLGRTFVALLLEPAALAVELAVARCDAALEVREIGRLALGSASPSADEQRAVSAHVEHLTVNLFAGCPELALRVADLPESGARALFVLLAHGELVFGRESRESAVRTRLDAFRHNSALECALGSRHALLWGVCRAALDQCDSNHADALRHTLLLALDAAQTHVAAMRQPYNASSANLATLRVVQRALRHADLPLPRRRREHAPPRPELAL